MVLSVIFPALLVIFSESSSGLVCTYVCPDRHPPPHSSLEGHQVELRVPREGVQVSPAGLDQVQLCIGTAHISLRTCLIKIRD